MTPDPAPFLRAIAANPEDDLRRLVYADWLEERAGSVHQTCRRCESLGWVVFSATPAGAMRKATCPDCKGKGSRRASNGNAERAEFIRVQCELWRLFGEQWDVDEVPSHRCTRCGCLWTCHTNTGWERCSWSVPACCEGEPCGQDFEALDEYEVGLFRRERSLTPWRDEYFESWTRAFDGIEIHRGFVRTVRGPLAALLAALPGALERMGPELWCVTTASVTDREPLDRRGQHWEWYDATGTFGELHPASDLPHDLFVQMWEDNEANRYDRYDDRRLRLVFATEADALVGLSDAILAVARRRAGLEADVVEEREAP